MEQNDKALMLAARNGNAEQFGVLFDRYHQRLFDFFYRLGSDAASSEDLVQEVDDLGVALHGRDRATATLHTQEEEVKAMLRVDSNKLSASAALK